MTMGASQLCMFAKSDSSLELPDLQWHVQPMSMDTLGATKNHDFHAFTPTVSVSYTHLTLPTICSV